jgi:hypothetical protein
LANLFHHRQSREFRRGYSKFGACSEGMGEAKIWRFRVRQQYPVVTEPFPRRQLPLSHLRAICDRSPCSSRIAGIHECTCLRQLPPSKNSGIWCPCYRLEGHETGSSPKGTHRDVRSPMSPASFSRPRHTVDPPRLHSLRFSPMITDHCAGSAEAPGAGLSPWSPR